MVRNPKSNKEVFGLVTNSYSQAHYACDCWDLEVLTSTGWVECVGCADRSAYDLAVHGNFTGKPLVVREHLEQPRTVEEWVIEIDRKKFGPYYKGKSKLTERCVVYQVIRLRDCEL